MRRNIEPFLEYAISNEASPEDVAKMRWLNKTSSPLRTRPKKKRLTKIVSTKLMLNLINVDDIVDAVKIVLRKNIKNGRYILKNSKYLNLYKLINKINKKSKIKIKVKWLSNNIIKNKIIRYDKLKSWKPQKSNINDIMNSILN